MRIAKLTKYGTLAASTRQRFDQYDRFLTERGHEVIDYPLLDNSYLMNIYSGKDITTAYLLHRYLHRLSKVIRPSNVDTFWIHYELFPYIPGIIERLFLPRDVTIVLDFDDAVFETYRSSQNSLVRLSLRNKLVPLLRRADAVFCGNKYLMAYAAKNSDSAHVVPTILDTNVFRPPPRRIARPRSRIGWIGTPSTWRRYVAPMLDLLADEAEKADAVIFAIGGDAIGNPSPRLHTTDWREDHEISDIQSMDIGIMPLSDTPWARGKCGYKLIQYMACGLPVIASPVGVNTELVDHGVNGYLADSPQEWRYALSTLLADSQLRQQMGENGRRKVIDQYSLSRWGPLVASLLESASSDRNK